MNNLRTFGDHRLTDGCVYCGGAPDTREHVPSKALLDEPYPENLPVVPACGPCNASFSLDEEYVACLVDCVLAGVADPDRVSRPKVARMLRDKPKLLDLLARSRRAGEDAVSFAIDHARVRSVIVKLGRGHAMFELDAPVREEPTSVEWSPLTVLDEATRERFETPLETHLFPEVSSRMMQRVEMLSVRLASTTNPAETIEQRQLVAPGWIKVQLGRYRYLVTPLDAGHVAVRMVLSEYLACEVIWRDA